MSSKWAMSVVVVLGIWAPLAVAQRAQITDHILDPSRAVIPEAEVSLRNVDTGTRYPARSNEAGVNTAFLF